MKANQKLLTNKPTSMDLLLLETMAKNVCYKNNYSNGKEAWYGLVFGVVFIRVRVVLGPASAVCP